MTDSSSRNLTWATFAAGVVSALLLVAIGCVKPSAGQGDASNLRSGFTPSAETGRPQQSFISHESGESIRRARDAGLPPSRH